MMEQKSEELASMGEILDMMEEEVNNIEKEEGEKRAVIFSPEVELIEKNESRGLVVFEVVDEEMFKEEETVAVKFGFSGSNRDSGFSSSNSSEVELELNVENEDDEESNDEFRQSALDAVRTRRAKQQLAEESRTPATLLRAASVEERDRSWTERSSRRMSMEERPPSAAGGHLSRGGTPVGHLSRAGSPRRSRPSSPRLSRPVSPHADNLLPR